MPVLIDGYNLLRSVEKVSDTETLTDTALCRLISNYLRYIGELGEIVFDGIGPREKGPFQNLPNLDVTFSGSQVEADEIIEIRIEANTAPKRLMVVSSDRRIVAAASKRKAVSVKVELFWAEMMATLARIPKKKKFAEPLEKRQGITEAETDYWLKVFGFKD
ncbi:MAG: hypothetical protein A2Y07_05530 [Planctomycetes bacterium GWF2_50_10]|nr:MAG: hypothetical protein A2Y07_05530 [Planctomycetes bacterium GWF2_50_10]